MPKSAQAFGLKGAALERFFSELKLGEQTDLSGSFGALGALCLAYLARTKGVTLLICSSAERALDLEKQTRTWLGADSEQLICMRPERNIIYDQTAAPQAIITDRLRALSARFNGGSLIILPVCVLAERFFSPQRWLNECFSISIGSDMPRSDFIKKLVKCGYKRVNVVEERGEFAVRGALLDVFVPNMQFPARLDFFGDELDTIKLFSSVTQRSFDKRACLSIIPAFEYIAEEGEISALQTHIAEEIDKIDEHKAELLMRRLKHLLSHADSRDYRELKPFIQKGEANFLDYFDGCKILIDEPQQVFEALDEFYGRLCAQYERLADLTPLLEPQFYYFNPEVIKERLKNSSFIKFSRFGISENKLFNGINIQSPPSDLSRETLIKDLRALLAENWAVEIFIEDENRLNNLRGLLGERKIKIHSAKNPFGVKYGSVLFSQGASTRGFKDNKRKIAIFTEADIFAQSVPKSLKSAHASQGQIMGVLSQIVPGDIVVHSDHGLAEFRGIQTMTAAGNTREYLLLQYAGADRLYVPTDQVQKITKYVGMEGVAPRINSLNSKAWAATKYKAGKNAEQIAKDLLDLYAKRIAAEGFAFAPDCDLQKQVEEKFAFIETPDQKKAIEATKKDMESKTPMDRLICGDVGYGKTEVAVRAAFKAVCGGKQVAILAPTTLLVFQHFQTFSKRFEGFPVSVDFICRLKKTAEQKEIIKKAKSGVLDVLIGTHRILSSDVTFKNLGLLIVDEEQRFGVKHKEKLKKLKSQIDVLTLTATPIPRTLQMAMSGIRQISVIDTPPEDRRSVQTYVSPYDASWVKRAIIEELKRGGQVYYVFNRVDRIEKKAEVLHALVPEARIAIAHGQMTEGRVENIMLEFIAGKYDVLLATTIIESGLDISNVNTLIVDEAERLGLSQMYQLRGRVGRSSRQAWAYFFYSNQKSLTKEAAERLETIEEHTALGSGFKIAMRDLQIRGAGNILGESQSGHISSVGFSLYMELLEDAVNRLKKGKTEPEQIESAVEIPITAYLPKAYVADEETRVEVYSRLARCGDIKLLNGILSECEDRFGSLPVEAKNLFAISRLRVLGSIAGIKKITRVLNHLRFEFAPNRFVDIAELFAADSAVSAAIYFEPADKNALNLNIERDSFDSIYSSALSLLELIASQRKNLANKQQPA